MSDILEQLFWRRAPMEVIDPTKDSRCETGCALSAFGSSRDVELGYPFVVRKFTRAAAGTLWPQFCKFLKDQRIPLMCAADDLNDIPVSSVPLRMARIGHGVIDPNEVTSADAIEIECRNHPDGRWGWPAELGREHMGAFVEGIRAATGGDAPIGISLPLGANINDVQAMVQAEVDFITLESSRQIDSIGIVNLTQVSDLLASSTVQRTTLIVDVPVAVPDSLLKLLALGRSVVCIDQLVHDTLSVQEELPSKQQRVLSSLTSAVTKQNQLLQLEEKVSQLENALSDVMQKVGVVDVSQLQRTALCSGDGTLSRLSGVQGIDG